MKKAILLLIIIGLLGLLLQVTITFFTVEKNSKYTLKTEDNNYVINEHFKVVDDISYYNMEITDKKGQVYSVFLEENFNKQSEIIRDIKLFKSKELSCIFPIFRRDITSNMSCLYNGEIVSYDYLKQIGNNDVKEIIEQLKKDEFHHNSWDDNVSAKEKLFSDGKGIDVYKDNILDDYIFLIWRYKGLYILKKDKIMIKDYLEKDVYDNSLSAAVDKYYVTADKNVDTGRVSNLLYYNINDFDKGKIALPETTSNDVYFNGVVDNILYMTDVGNKKQYGINPSKEKVIEVGDVSIGFLTFVDGEEIRVSANEFLTSKVYFNNVSIINKEISKKYGNDVQIKKDREYYYFKCSNGKLYKSHIDNPTQAKLLFQFKNLNDWIVKDGDILLVSSDMVYFYNEDEGLLPIANNRELLYNYNNIIDFWKK